MIKIPKWALITFDSFIGIGWIISFWEVFHPYNIGLAKNYFILSDLMLITGFVFLFILPLLFIQWQIGLFTGTTLGSVYIICTSIWFSRWDNFYHFMHVRMLLGIIILVLSIIGIVVLTLKRTSAKGNDQQI